MSPARRAAERPLRLAILSALAGLLIAVAALPTVSCGGGQTRGHPLDSSWSDESGEELAEFQRGFRFDIRPRLTQVAVGVADGETLVGRALEARQTWRYEHPLESRPVIAGSVVVGVGGGELFALDAETGKPIWERKAVGYLRGASDDGTTTLVSLQSLSGARSTVLAIDRRGTVQRQLYLEASIGAPLVVDAYAFLPYNRKIVLVFDLLEGTEAARVIADGPVSHAFRVGDEIYFGETEALRFDEAIVAARRGQGHEVRLPDRNFARRPAWHLPGSMPSPVEATRDDAVRYQARPVIVDGEARIDRYALRHFTAVLGLRAPSGELIWAHRNDAPYLGGWAGHRSQALCDAAGNLRWLDGRTGAVIHEDSLGQAVIACAIQSESPAERAVPPPRPPLADQIVDLLSDPRPELLPLQIDLIAELDEIPTPSATAGLARLARKDSPAAAPIRREARERLAERHQGLDVLLELVRRDDERPRWSTSDLPLAAIARALGRRPDTRTRRILADRLLDPSLTAPEAVALARAVESITLALASGPTPSPPDPRGQLRSMLVRFLAASACPAPPFREATLAVARSLVALGASTVVAQASRRPCDLPGMAASLRAVVDDHADGAR